MRLREYREKPNVKFWGSDDYYLGVELEVEAPDRDKQLLGLKPLVWGVNAKKDGSLNCYGWEIVTHPYARNLWLEPRPRAGAVYRLLKLVKTLKELDYVSHDCGRCGMHVHVCRKAFGPELGTHYYWFARLVNGPLFCKLSQRGNSGGLDRYAKQLEVTPSNLNPEPHNRYTAINLRNRNTVEVRIFRGNLREDRIRKNVEAVIAAIEFARSLAPSDGTGERELKLDNDFVAWVVGNRTTYPNLAKYLREIGAVAVREDRDPNPEETLVCA